MHAAEKPLDPAGFRAHALRMAMGGCRTGAGDAAAIGRALAAVEAARARSADASTVDAAGVRDGTGLWPRERFARAAFAALEGGRAAILRPERRVGLHRSALRLGLRPFEASLLIAIAQDAARHGESIEAIRTLRGAVPSGCGIGKPGHGPVFLLGGIVVGLLLACGAALWLAWPDSLARSPQNRSLHRQNPRSIIHAEPLQPILNQSQKPMANTKHHSPRVNVRCLHHGTNHGIQPRTIPAPRQNAGACGAAHGD